MTVQIHPPMTEYLQSQKEVLTFGLRFAFAIDHQAVQFLPNSNKFMATSMAKVIQIWSVASEAYNYNVVHCLGQTIRQADLLWRYSAFSPTE